MPPSPGATAPICFTPAADQSAVAHLKFVVQTVTPLPGGALRLSVACGDLSFDLGIPALPGRPDFRPGDRLLAEYPKQNNPLTTRYTAVYPEHLKPQPQPIPTTRSANMSKLIPFQFENTSIRVVTGDNGEPLFVGKDICEALGYADHTNAIKQHCRGVVKRHPIVDSLGRTQEARVLAEPDVMRLMTNSTLPAAEAFERLVFEEILPTIRKTGSYTAPAAKRPQTLSRNQVAASILLLRSAAEDLKLAPSAVLGGYQRLESQLGVVGLLPAYAVDAPNTSVAGSSDVAKPVGQLLEDFGVSMSAVAFNRLLLQAGFLQEVERKSTNGTKKYKSVTDMEYGKNATHPNNQKETQPLWYASKFKELLSLVLPAKPEAVA